MSRDCPEVVLLTIRVPKPTGSEPDGWQRLRKLLKALIRAYGLKCESIEPVITPIPNKENQTDEQMRELLQRANERPVQVIGRAR